MELINLVGKRFGMLVVVSRGQGKSQGHTYWRCKCDCGNETIVEGYKLRTGHTKSCGCSSGKMISASKMRHGLSKTRLHRIWDNMKRRCNTENYPFFDDYGGRGITICDEWNNSFDKFAEWSFANGYSEELSIDRIDNDKGYSPDNCRWTTPLVQGSNKRNNIATIYKGERIIVAELARKIGISRATCKKYILKGFNGDEIERRFSNGKRSSRS